MLVYYVSVVMAVVWFTLAALIGCLILPKMRKYGLAFVAILLILALLRLFLPLTPQLSIIIPSEVIYPAVMRWIRAPLIGSLTGGAVLWLIWGIGALAMFTRLAWKLSQQFRYWRNAPRVSADSGLYRLARETAAEIGYNGVIKLAISPTERTAFQLGMIRPCILLPQNVQELPERIVQNVLRHELSHYAGRDIWIKLGVSLLGCVMWWNPVMYLLDRSVEQMLELRCDSRACRGFDKEGRTDYSDDLLAMIKNVNSGKIGLSVGYLGVSEKKLITQRFELLVADGPGRRSWVKLIAAGAVCVVLFAASYYVEVGPRSKPPEEDMEYTVTISRETSYIVHTEDGRYQLYFEGSYVGELTEDDLRHRPLSNLEIYEERDISK